MGSVALWLLMYTRAVDWPFRTLLLSVPAVVAERLLRHWSSLKASECQGDPDDTQSHESILRSAVAAKDSENGAGAYLPGTLDDTSIGQRRCEDGRSGILPAEAGDLPDAVIAPLIADSVLPEPGAEDTPADEDSGEDGYERWRTGGREPRHPDFGAHRVQVAEVASAAPLASARGLERPAGWEDGYTRRNQPPAPS